MAYDDFYDYEEYDDTGGLGPEGCLYPEKCCVPGFHWESECHTIEDLEALEKEAEKET